MDAMEVVLSNCKSFLWEILSWGVCEQGLLWSFLGKLFASGKKNIGLGMGNHEGCCDEEAEERQGDTDRKCYFIECGISFWISNPCSKPCGLPWPYLVDVQWPPELQYHDGFSWYFADRKFMFCHVLFDLCVFINVAWLFILSFVSSVVLLFK